MIPFAIQGDIVFHKIKALPKEAKKKTGLILVYGEATQHSHRLLAGQVYELGSRLFFTTNKKTQCVHDEHDPIDFPKGIYEVTRQREITSGDMTRIVVD